MRGVLTKICSTNPSIYTRIMNNDPMNIEYYHAPTENSIWIFNAKPIDYAGEFTYIQTEVKSVIDTELGQIIVTQNSEYMLKPSES